MRGPKCFAIMPAATQHKPPNKKRTAHSWGRMPLIAEKRAWIIMVKTFSRLNSGIAIWTARYLDNR